MLALLAAGVTVAVFFANALIPQLFPRLYDEDRWTIGKHSLHTVFVLLCISLSNYLILKLSDNDTPTFANMFLTVTIIGFFPITLTVLLAEQRRLRRNLRQAELLNRALPTPVAASIHPTPAVAPSPAPLATDAVQTDIPASITFVPSVGKDRLTLQPDQLLAAESLANYAELYWLKGDVLQKTTLRLTLKEVENVLANYPQFFRCHRAFVVNLNAVQHTTGNARGYQLTVRNLAQEIPVSRGYADAFEGRFLGTRS